jgi:hypothetical protein
LRIPVARIGVTVADRDLSATAKDKDGVKGKGGEERLLNAEAEEMVKLMRRSVSLHEGKERRLGLGLYGNGNEEWWDVQAEAERRVGLVELSGEDEGEWAREFFEDVLGRG